MKRIVIIPIVILIGIAGIIGYQSYLSSSTDNPPDRSATDIAATITRAYPAMKSDSVFVVDTYHRVGNKWYIAVLKSPSNNDKLFTILYDGSVGANAMKVIIPPYSHHVASDFPVDDPSLPAVIINELLQKEKNE